MKEDNIFVSKVNFLLTVLGASNSDIAHMIGVDPSNISRLKTGKRLPAKNSSSISHFIEGVYLFALQHQKLSILERIFDNQNSLDEKSLKTALQNWLFNDDNVPNLSPKQTENNLRFFGEKLDAVMNLLGLSNRQMAKILNTDPSYISHFRTGTRTPKLTNQLIQDICLLLAEQLIQQNKLIDFQKLLLSKEILPAQPDKLRETLFIWFGNITPLTAQSPIIDFVNYLDSFEIENSENIPDIDPSAFKEFYQQQSQYYKYEGFRQATLRFLIDAAENKGELWLYSDQAMTWMFEDKIYLSRWKALMCHCIKSGVQIKIIHNINRDSREMIKSIESWLPLYMSGMIQPYYCKKKPDNRFSNTLFLCPGIACIEATHVRNFENEGVYNYHTQAERLELLKKEFLGLLYDCEPLLQIFTENDKENFLFAFNHKPQKTINNLLPTLSLATMPEKLMQDIAKTSALSSAEKLHFKTLWKLQKDQLRYALENGHVFEFLPLQNPITDNIPIDCQNIILSQEINYSPKQYNLHLKQILKISQEHYNFFPVPLNQKIFEHVQLIIGSQQVMVMKRNNPRIVFLFTHPLMLKAFNDYIEQLKNKHDYYKEETNLLLKKYLDCSLAD